MPTRSSDRFPTVHTEGAILPADLLQRVAAGDASLEGMSPESYHLVAGERVNEATNRAWNRLLGVWSVFQHGLEKLPANDPGTSLTRERWLLPLFQELGFGRLPLGKAIELEDKSYPISHTWSHVPIHLVGCRIDLDRRAPGVAGAAHASPHGLVQELLNRSEEHLWGMVSNGLKLRLLRDNIRLTRQAFVEFDMQAMLDGKVYADFALLWRLCHQSRLEAEKPSDYWLERWSKLAQQQGLRVLDQLRDGVEKAIAALGRGFLACPANQALRDKLQAGNLDAQDYYRQLLRLVYRLLFLFVAEDRELLFDPRSDEAAHDRYTRYYSSTRLRRLAERLRGSQHTDLYQGLTLVLNRLGNGGCPELALPALGSFLFSPDATPDLNGCHLTNTDLLDTARALALTSDGHALRPVDYRNLGSEELGSIYESLLELHPVLNQEAGTFELRTASGHERKTTGSYYTPTSLITCLLDSALDPVLAEAAKNSDPEQALLALKVCDPACGSGHFLIAAAHRIAKRLAYIRTGEEEPPPQAVRHAVRDAIGHCVYGVDLNPMAVELCKVALWMEALEPGKPLSFLDHHIQCGNSLLGTTPALIARGIPDEAFEPIEGDDKAICRAAKKQNQDDCRGQGSLYDEDRPWNRLGDLAMAMQGLELESDDTLAGVRRKQERYAELVRSSGYLYGHFLADAWCAAFVWRKDRTFDYSITERILRRIEHNPHDVTSWMRQEIERLAHLYQFFHWHLAFPDVFHPALDPKPEADPEHESVTGWTGGFDVVLGNPPWERIKLQEQEWFAERRPDIATAGNSTTRHRLIEELRTEDPSLYRLFLEDVRKADGESHLVRHSSRYPLCGRGDVNTYTLFAETNRQLICATGRVGCIVPSGIATDETTKAFFQDLVDTRSLVSLFDFENRERTLFPGVYYRMRFCLITYGSGFHPICPRPEFLFLGHRTEDLQDHFRRFSLTKEDIQLLNPNTRTCPIFRNRRDVELSKQIRHRVPVWKLLKPDGEESSWAVSIRRVIDMNLQAPKLKTRDEMEQLARETSDGNFSSENKRFLRLHEGKMLEMFHHRFADAYTVESLQRSGRATEVLETELIDPFRLVEPRYWVDEEEVTKTIPSWNRQWLLAYMDVCSVTNARTAICTVVPWSATSFSLRVLANTSAPNRHIACLCANLNSFAFDYYARQFVSGLHLSDYLMFQMPVLPPRTYDRPVTWARDAKDLADWVVARVLELSYTAWDLQPFARDCGCEFAPFRWNPDRRFLLRCELDAVFFHLYGISRDDADYVMETFTIVKRKTLRSTADI